MDATGLESSTGCEEGAGKNAWFQETGGDSLRYPGFSM